MENFQLYIRRGFLVIYRNSEFITSVDINHIVSVGINCCDDIILYLTGEGGKHLHGLIIGELNINNERLGNKLAYTITQGIVNYKKILDHFITIEYGHMHCMIYLKNISYLRFKFPSLNIVENKHRHDFDISDDKIYDKLLLAVREHKEYIDEYNLFKTVVLETKISFKE